MKRNTTIGDHFISLHLGEKTLIQNKKLVRSKSANTTYLENSMLNAKYQCKMVESESRKKGFCPIRHCACLNRLEPRNSCYFPRNAEILLSSLNTSTTKLVGVSRNTKPLSKYLDKEESRYRLSPSTGIAKLRPASEATMAAKTLISMNRKDQAIKKATFEIKDKRCVRASKEEMKKGKQSKFINVANTIIAAKLLGNRNLLEKNDD